MNDASEMDQAHMREALRQAERGLFTTQPNPRVGCVIVHGSDIIGRGFHQRAGGPHAEVHALAEAGDRARGATAYVTLEPCAHSGRTGPCADALIAAGIERVVMACEDPFEQVNGRGQARLRAAGIRVDGGLMRDEARALNVGFFSRIERGRPFVRVKVAASLDGRTALPDGSSQWITGAEARQDGHLWRARASALLTGIGTVAADNPQLTVRIAEPHADIRPIIVDSQLRIAADARILQGAQSALIFAHETSEPMRRAALTEHGVEVVLLSGQHRRIDLAKMLSELARRDVNELHVEAGPTLTGALLAAGLVDELLIYQNGCLLGDTAKPMWHLDSPARMADRAQWNLHEVLQLGADWRLRLQPERRERGADELECEAAKSGDTKSCSLD